MVAASISWDFASNLSPSSASGGLTGSWGPLGSTPANWESGAYSWRFQDLGAVRLLVGPPAGTVWTPTSITFKVRRSAGAGDGYFSLGGDYTAEWSGALTTSYQTVTVDLSSLGSVDGPTELRWWAGGTTTQRAYLDDVVVTGSVVSGADQNVTPASLLSAAAIGNPTLVAVTTLAVVGVASSEAFGLPALWEYVPPALVLAPVGIPSATELGTPSLVPMTPGAVPLPTGADVAAFLGSQTGGLAELHVGVITEFARVYTRGNGFYPDGVAEPLAGVILAATARLVGNPEQLDIQVGSVRRASFFKGWSLAEQRVLNNYRGVAA